MEKVDLFKQQQDFIKSLETSGKSFNTLKNYRTDLNIFNKFLQSRGRELFLKEVTHSQTQDYQNYLEKKYNSPNSIRRRVQALRMFFDYLIEKNLIDHNPIKKMMVSPKVVDLPKPIPFPKVQQLKHLLLTAKNTETGHTKLLASRNLVLFYLIYGSGLKVSNIERLRINHITFHKNQYRVLIASEKKDPFTVLLPLEFNEVHEEYLELLEEGKNRDNINFNELFFNANPFKILKGGLSARGIEVLFKDFSQKLNFEVTARSLRQACIFKWIGAGIPLARIKEWMGVQPQYSLKPFETLMKERPDEFAFLDI